MKFNIPNRRDDLFTSNEVVLGVLAGAVIGLAAGILLAPRSGSDTRSQIADAVNDGAENIGDKWSKTTAKAKDAFDSVKAKAGVAAEKVGDTVDQYADEARHKADKFSAKADDAADELADDSRSLLNRAKDAFKIG